MNDKISKELGYLFTEATEFLHEALCQKSGEVDAQTKATIISKRESIFNEVRPLIQQLTSLEEEEREQIEQLTSLNYMSEVSGFETKVSELEEALEKLDENDDEAYIMSVQSLYMILSFLTPEELEDFAPHLLEFNGF